MVQQLGFK